MKQLMEFKYKLKPQIEFLKNGKVLTDGDNYLLDFFKILLKRFFKIRIQSCKYILVNLGLIYNRLEL